MVSQLGLDPAAAAVTVISIFSEINLLLVVSVAVIVAVYIFTDVKYPVNSPDVLSILRPAPPAVPPDKE